jgi:hypothetical protein
MLYIVVVVVYSAQDNDRKRKYINGHVVDEKLLFWVNYLTHGV